MENRSVPATFTVSNTDNLGLGSLRDAITSANESPGADSIVFTATGTGILGSPLPNITDPVDINALSANTVPTFGINANGFAGLVLETGGTDSSIKGLSVGGAAGAGITLNGANITVANNYIGLALDGSTSLPNTGDGVKITSNSGGNLIGNADPLSSIDYFKSDGVSAPSAPFWQGVRASDTAGNFLIAGTSGSNGVLYDGPINGVGGTSFLVNLPGANTTSVYGPDNLANGKIRLVGSYRANNLINGFLFEGTTSDFANAANYTTMNYPGATYTFVHSTMGGFAVGNGDGPEGNAPLGTGHAFLYEIANNAISDIVFPGSLSTTVYGIWDNGGKSYTIAGGYSNTGNPNAALSHGYIADYNSLTNTYSNWTSYDYPNGEFGQNFITHFEGISSVENGVYTLSANSLQTGDGNLQQGSWVSVRRNANNTFGDGAWLDLNFNGVPSNLLTSSNSVMGNAVVGIVIDGANSFGYQANLNFSFQLSNVISSNGGNGISVDGAIFNQISMNFIGSDFSGKLDRGNFLNGILLTNEAIGNIIGGQATAGNDPTGNVFARPPMGNLISGNGQNGVLIEAGANDNLLSGNYIGTNVTASFPLPTTAMASLWSMPVITRSLAALCSRILSFFTMSLAATEAMAFAFPTRIMSQSMPIFSAWGLITPH